jgi:DNA-directed RNA polymerase subunit RPC12/RpoP
MVDAPYQISKCPRCKTLFIADRRYATKTCPKCNSRIELAGLTVLSTAKDARQARELLAKAKLEESMPKQT